ncbi:hypothetical protein ACA910_006286 [Epithemia clementina (nom. ined.)]
MTIVAALTDNDGPLFYPTGIVKANVEFFWVGRGGFGISHPGNQHVKQIIKTRKSEYKALKRSERGRFVRDLLNDELHNIKFVIPRAHLIKKMQADDKDRRTTTSSQEEETSSTNSDATHRRVGDARREGLIETHESMEKIESYPSDKDDDVCIVVGDNWTFDIISHLLRDSSCAEPKTQIVKTTQQLRQKTNTTESKADKPTLASKKRERQQDVDDIETYERVFDFSTRLSNGMLLEQLSVKDMFAALFPEEAGIEPYPYTAFAQQKVDLTVQQTTEEELNVYGQTNCKRRKTATSFDAPACDTYDELDQVHEHEVSDFLLNANFDYLESTDLYLTQEILNLA